MGDQMTHIGSIMKKLEATNRYHSTKMEDAEMNILAKMFDVFPPNEIFPALDLVRLVILLPDASERARQQYWTTILTKADELCKKEENLQGPAAVAIPMLTLRLYTNAFKGGTGSQQA